MEKTFRGMVLASFIAFVVWWYFPYIDPLLTDDPEKLYFWDSAGFDAKYEFPPWFFHLWFVFWTVSYVGLFLFYRPMRSIFLAGYVISMATVPFHGTVIQSPWSSIVGHFGAMLDGGIIAVAYLTSVSTRFGASVRKQAS